MFKALDDLPRRRETKDRFVWEFANIDLGIEKWKIRYGYGTGAVLEG
jgi:hypothetical protein